MFFRILSKRLLNFGFESQKRILSDKNNINCNQDKKESIQIISKVLNVEFRENVKRIKMSNRENA